MIKADLYHKTVDILYQAYFNDTLEHGNCYACAVGNLVAANCGYKLVNSFLPHERFVWESGLPSNWQMVHSVAYRRYVPSGNPQRVTPENYFRDDEARQEIDSTGYTFQETARIEKAFESAPYGSSSEDWMFNGLVAVLEVLKEIHQVDAPTASQNKQRFTHHYETLTA